MKKYKKGYTLVELFLVLVLIVIIGGFANSVYSWYVRNAIEDKRIKLTQTINASFKEIVGRNGDIPTNYCTNDGGTTYSSACFSSLGCTDHVFCNEANGSCSNAGAYYYDFDKALSDFGYSISDELRVNGEKIPLGFNYKLCPFSATGKSHNNNAFPKESGFAGSDPVVGNPSYFVKFLNNGAVNIGVEQYSSDL